MVLHITLKMNEKVVRLFKYGQLILVHLKYTDIITFSKDE